MAKDGKGTDVVLFTDGACRACECDEPLHAARA